MPPTRAVGKAPNVPTVAPVVPVLIPVAPTTPTPGNFATHDQVAAFLGWFPECHHRRVWLESGWKLGTIFRDLAIFLRVSEGRGRLKRLDVRTCRWSMVRTRQTRKDRRGYRERRQSPSSPNLNGSVTANPNTNQRTAASGFAPIGTDNPYSTMTHEFGHLVAALATRRSSRRL